MIVKGSGIQAVGMTVFFPVTSIVFHPIYLRPLPPLIHAALIHCVRKLLTHSRIVNASDTILSHSNN